MKLKKIKPIVYTVGPIISIIVVLALLLHYTNFKLLLTNYITGNIELIITILTMINLIVTTLILIKLIRPEPRTIIDEKSLSNIAEKLNELIKLINKTIKDTTMITEPISHIRILSKPAEEIKNILETIIKLGDEVKKIGEEIRTNLYSAIDNVKNQIDNLVKQNTGLENKLSNLDSRIDKLSRDIKDNQNKLITKIDELKLTIGNTLGKVCNKSIEVIYEETLRDIVNHIYYSIIKKGLTEDLTNSLSRTKIDRESICGRISQVSSRRIERFSDILDAVAFIVQVEYCNLSQSNIKELENNIIESIINMIKQKLDKQIIIDKICTESILGK